MHYNQMYVFEFLMYHMKLYGNDRLPKKITLDEIKNRLELKTEINGTAIS